MKISWKLWAFLTAFIAGSYIFLVIKANANLTDGRFALFMDERITFDGVRRILHADSFGDGLRMILRGDDQRYGRSLWNSLALFAFVPDFLWGEKAQIIAGRMTQVFLLFSAFFILAFAFIKDWMLRLLLLAALLAMPYTDYYMSMPKPEPLQLLFFAAFLYFYRKADFGFGRHWLFLGLAFGTKIAALPAVLLFIFLSGLLEARKKNNLVSDRSHIYICSIKFFVIGFAIAVPLFLPAVAIAYVLHWSCQRLASRYGKSPAFNIWKWLFIGGSAVLVARTAKTPFFLWFDSTFMNTAHGGDSSDINFFSWIEYFFNGWMVAPQWFVLLLFAAAATLASVYALPFLTRYSLSNKPPPVGLILIVCGIGLNLAIFVGAHRLWGFYLFPGTVLALTGVVAILDDRASGSGGEYAVMRSAAMRYSAYATGCLLLVLIVLWWAPAALKELDILSRRTDQTVYKKNDLSYRQTLNFLNAYSGEIGKRLHVVYDPNLFPPNKSPAFDITEFWGPLNNWDMGQDVIAFGASHGPDGPGVPVSSPEHEAYLQERAAYAKYVIGKGESCLREKCFERVLTLQNGGEILVLKKAAGKPQ
jgi:hypothetical protein